MIDAKNGRVSWLVPLCLGPILCTVSGAAELKVQSTEAPPEEVAAIDLALTEGQAVGALESTLTFDPAHLEYIEIAAGPAASQSLIQAHLVAPGHLRFAMVASEGIGGDGVIASVKFRVLAPDGTNIPLGLEEARAHHYEKLIELPLTVVGGELAVVTAAAEPESPANLLDSFPREWLIGGAVVLGLLLLVIAFRAGRGSRKG